MNPIIPLLQDRISALLEKLTNARLENQNPPDGSLKVSFQGKIPQYYQALPHQTKKPKYIRKENKELAVRLAQKEYNNKLISSLSKEIQLLDALKEFYNTSSPEDIFEKLPVGKAALIKPAFITDEQFIREWLDVPYTKLGFPDNSPALYTGNGIRVRSKSEIVIGNLFEKYNIPYRYEFPTKIKGRIIYPDFTILKRSTRQEIVWEHFGLLDNSEYREQFMTKYNNYLLSGYYPGISLMMSFETGQQPLNTKAVARMIEECCQ